MSGSSSMTRRKLPNSGLLAAGPAATADWHDAAMAPGTAGVSILKIDLAGIRMHCHGMSE